MVGKDSWDIWHYYVHTAAFEVDSQQGSVYSTETSKCYVAAWVGGVLGENGYICMYGWVPLLVTGNYHNIAKWLYSNAQ